MRIGFAFFILVAGLLSCLPAQAEQWPQWRGPTLDGISRETGIPVRWSPTENVLWRVPLPGPAGSTPVIWDKNIFLTTVDADGVLWLMSFSTDGQEKWRRQLDSGNRDVRGDEGNSASASPATDGKHVWAMVATGVLACYTVNGEEVWKVNLPDRYGKLVIQFGLTSTPVLDKGKLFLQLIHGEGKAATEEAVVVCLNGADGKEIWRQKRITGASQENEHSYSSPTIFRSESEDLLITHGGDYVMAHRLTDGSEVWRYCLNPQGALYHPTLRFVASPLAADGFIVAPSAKNGPVVAIRGDAKGELPTTGQSVNWRRDKGTPDVPSPLYYDGLVYLCRENGNLVCVDAKSGETIYEERTTADRHRASPVFADGKVYLTARNGVISVVEAGRTFKLLSQNDLGEVTSASPAISGGRIYIRTFEALYAIGK